jgi:hypothetical protein
MARVQKSRGDSVVETRSSECHPCLPFSHPLSLRAQGFTMQSSQTSQTSPNEPLACKSSAVTSVEAQTILQERNAKKKQKRSRRVGTA